MTSWLSDKSNTRKYTFGLFPASPDQYVKGTVRYFWSIEKFNLSGTIFSTYWHSVYLLSNSF